ncbi:hypothetical protein NHX12_028243, partial [Muraenolepis orangiensis]
MKSVTTPDGDQIRLLPDFTQAVSKQRAAFTERVEPGDLCCSLWAQQSSTTEATALSAVISPIGPSDHPVHQSECSVSMAVMTSRKHQELEARLEDMLSRIAMETLEIKQLEQQLTEGQILVNEALQADLQGIVSGIQEYMGGLRLQQFQGGLDQLLEAVVSGQESLSPHGLDDASSDMLRHAHRDIQRYIAERIGQNRDLQIRDQQVQGEKLREELQGARDSLHNSQAQIRRLQQTMVTSKDSAGNSGADAEEGERGRHSSGGPAMGFSAGVADSQEPLSGGPASLACNLPEHTDLSELEGLDHRLEESATCLLETKRQLWETEEELQQ